MSQVSHSIRQLLTKVGLRRSSWLPQQLFDDDVFIVAYPKSGTTWLRFQLANLLRRRDGEEIDFHNIRTAIPDVGSPQERMLSQRPRILSTHATYTCQFKRVIYVVRDGRDVYASYYHHLRRSLPAGMTFSQFLRHGVRWPSRWSPHVMGWSSDSGSQQQLIVRYEDMRTDGAGQLRRVADYIGLSATDREVQDAVERSAFGRMQKVESVKGRYNGDSGPKQFVRKGIVGDWANTFSPSDLSFFESVEHEAMDRLGYAITGESQSLRSSA